METAEVELSAGTLLETTTLQVTLLPPPPTMPRHWSIVVVSSPEDVVSVLQPEGGNTPDAARHAVAVTTELSAPTAEMVFTTVRVQVTHIRLRWGRCLRCTGQPRRHLLRQPACQQSRHRSTWPWQSPTP